MVFSWGAAVADGAKPAMADTERVAAPSARLSRRLMLRRDEVLSVIGGLPSLPETPLVTGQREDVAAGADRPLDLGIGGVFLRYCAEICAASGMENENVTPGPSFGAAQSFPL